MSEQPRHGQLSMLRLLHAVVWLGVAFALWGAMLRFPVISTTPPQPNVLPIIGCLAGGVFAFGTAVGVLLGRPVLAATVFLVVAILISSCLLAPAFIR
jgi:hypothetical protein